MEKDLWATASVSEDVVKAIAVMLGNFSRLRSTDEASQSIPQLVGALKAGNEPAQEAALEALYLLQDDWSNSPAEVGKAQAMAAAEAIPMLQLLMREGPPRFQEKIESLLQCLPGSLVVTVKNGHNLKQSMGSTNAFCKLTLGNGPPRQTKVCALPQLFRSYSGLLGLTVRLCNKSQGNFQLGVRMLPKRLTLHWTRNVTVVGFFLF